MTTFTEARAIVTGVPTLDVKDLHAAYGQIRVLHGISFVVDAGGITALLGANGAGKTTTLRAVCNMVRTEGQILLNGARIDGRATEDIVRQGVAHVPDGRGTFMELTVEENMRLGSYIRHDKDVEGDRARIFGYFPKLKERYRQQAGTLSGGEQQMVAMARALMGRPRLICMDEPTMGLSPRFVDVVLELIAAINRDGVTVFMVEQNASLALKIADRAYLLETGRIVFSGPAAEIRQDENIRRSYLGY